MWPGNVRAEPAAWNPGSWLHGLRWVPVPLAVLAAVVGWLVLGSMQGQQVAARVHQHGYQAGGLALAVDQMTWMSNDMTGQGPVKAKVKGFPMDSSQMPGMQSASDNRLRVEVILRNITATTQRYAMSDFKVVAPGGQHWTTADDGGTGSAAAGALAPGFEATVDMYFDIPIKQSKNLSIEWSRDGTTVEFPVNTSGIPAPHIH
jgi:hypothetical protein